MKLKLTAIDGSRVRRVGVAWFGSTRTDDYGESGLTVLTNQGDLHVVSLPGVKLQVQYPCIRREDVSGIASCVFTKHGQGRTRETRTHTVYISQAFGISCIQFFSPLMPSIFITCALSPSGFYLISPSEFERFSLSARCVVEPRSLVEVSSQIPSTTLPRAPPDGASVERRYTHTCFYSCIHHRLWKYCFLAQLPFHVLLNSCVCHSRNSTRDGVGKITCCLYRFKELI